MVIKDIQARLDENVEKKCKQEWQAAKEQIYDIIAPFFKNSSDLPVEKKAELKEDFTKRFRMTDNAEPKLFVDYPVPFWYVARKKEEASKEFVAKVDKMEAQLEELYCQVENMQR